MNARTVFVQKLFMRLWPIYFSWVFRSAKQSQVEIHADATSPKGAPDVRIVETARRSQTFPSKAKAAYPSWSSRSYVCLQSDRLNCETTANLTGSARRLDRGVNRRKLAGPVVPHCKRPYALPRRWCSPGKVVYSLSYRLGSKSSVPQTGRLP